MKSPVILFFGLLVLKCFVHTRVHSHSRQNLEKLTWTKTKLSDCCGCTWLRQPVSILTFPSARGDLRNWFPRALWLANGFSRRVVVKACKKKPAGWRAQWLMAGPGVSSQTEHTFRTPDRFAEWAKWLMLAQPPWLSSRAAVELLLYL